MTILTIYDALHNNGTFRLVLNIVIAMLMNNVLVLRNGTDL